MEHVVQFAISMDDEAIKQSVAKNAENVIIKDLKESVEEVVFDIRRTWSKERQREGLTRWAEKHFEEFLVENKSEIIEEAANMLADRLSRTKMAREALSRVLEGEEV